GGRWPASLSRFDARGGRIVRRCSCGSGRRGGHRACLRVLPRGRGPRGGRRRGGGGGGRRRGGRVGVPSRGTSPPPWRGGRPRLDACAPVLWRRCGGRGDAAVWLVRGRVGSLGSVFFRGRWCRILGRGGAGCGSSWLALAA